MIGLVIKQLKHNAALGNGESCRNDLRVCGKSIMLLRWFCIIANKMCKRFVSAFMHQRPYVFKLSIYMSICLFVSIYLLPDKPLPSWLTDCVHVYICLPVHLRCLYFENKWKEVWHAFVSWLHTMEITKKELPQIGHVLYPDLQN